MPISSFLTLAINMAIELGLPRASLETAGDEHSRRSVYQLDRVDRC
jgi:hypothetical protein